MPQVHLSQRSRADLKEISEYLGDYSLFAAERTIDQLVERLRILRDHPLIGHPLDRVRPGLRSLRCGNYIILYHSRPSSVEISRIVHHARDLPRLEGIDPPL